MCKNQNFEKDHDRTSITKELAQLKNFVPIRKHEKISLTSFLRGGTFSEKNQPVVSYRLVSWLWVLTVYFSFMKISKMIF